MTYTPVSFPCRPPIVIPRNLTRPWLSRRSPTPARRLDPASSSATPASTWRWQSMRELSRSARVGVITMPKSCSGRVPQRLRTGRSAFSMPCGSGQMDDDQARARLLAYSLVRAAGLGIFLFGVAVIYTNLLRPGGWPQVGAIIAICGVIDDFFAPRILKLAWNQKDRERQ